MICDEAENCEWEQIKTFVTRICEGTKCVLSGDIKQADVYKYNVPFQEFMNNKYDYNK
jgi:predicted ribonuclease YlaK